MVIGCAAFGISEAFSVGVYRGFGLLAKAIAPHVRTHAYCCDECLALVLSMYSAYVGTRTQINPPCSLVAGFGFGGV